MRINKLTLILVCELLLPLAKGQVISDTLAARLRASADGSATSVRAGDTFRVHITLNEPAPRDLDFSLPVVCNGAGGFSLYGRISKGGSGSDADATVPPATSSGECRASDLRIAPPPQETNRIGQDGRIMEATSITLKTQLSFTVLGLPHVAETMPSTASAQIEVTARQYIRSQTVPLRFLKDELTKQLQSSSADTVSLRAELVRYVALADASLLAVRTHYEQAYKVTNLSMPVFFTDLHRRYQALLVDLKAPRDGAATAYLNPETRFILTQLTARPQNSEQNRPGIYSGTYPPVVNAALELIDWNLAAYEKLADTGNANFHLTVASLPTNATVSKKRIGEEFYVIGQPTNITDLTLDFAIWTFKFTRAGCKDRFREYDPVKDTSPVLEVELICR